MQTIKFHKYQGAGNDFILIDNRSNSFEWSEAIIQHLCDRRFGIGSDGVILLEEDSQSKFYMRYFNPDGSQVGMCGNGSRCIVLFAHHLGIDTNNLTFRALDGLHSAQITSTNGEQAIVKVKMIDVEEIQEIDSKSYFTNSGVNHYIEFVECVDCVDIIHRGAKIRYSKQFSVLRGTNANFVEIINSAHILVRTYERGVENETLACGTGATAAALATAVKLNRYHSPIAVTVKGGELKIHFQNHGKGFENIHLEGEAQRVFTGEINI